MEIYLITSLVCVGIGYLLRDTMGQKQSQFEKELFGAVYQGKRVIICMDNDAYIFEMVDGKMRITRGVTDFNEVPIDVDDMGSVGFIKSDNSSNNN